MHIKLTEPIRKFAVGRGAEVIMSDCAQIILDSDEQVTFKTENGYEYDVARKSWGFYATPSINGRLKQNNLRTVLVKSPVNRYFIFLVEVGKESEFDKYMSTESLEVVLWLDNDEVLNRISQSLR